MPCVTTGFFYTIHLTQAEKCRLASLFDELKAPLLKYLYHLYKGYSIVANPKKHSVIYRMTLICEIICTSRSHWSRLPGPRDLIREVK